uniref:Uncharacterized protein n=1 Tax=mine drainage metagenome TaxID=410659 RepID=E6QM79_9ZZZZ
MGRDELSMNTESGVAVRRRSGEEVEQLVVGTSGSNHATRTQCLTFWNSPVCTTGC